jgi:hypothetical protein
MAKAPAERYGTAQELADDLRRFLEDRPILARRPSLRQRAWKWVRRHRTLTLTAAVSAVLFLVLAVVGLAVDDARVKWQKKQTEEAKQKTEQALRNETAAKNRAAEDRDHDWQVSYLRRIALARHEIQAGNSDRANQFLDECVPPDGQADPRCWEWRYLKRQCRGPLFTIRGNALFGNRVTFSPDGRRLAVGTSDAVFFLDAATGQLLRDYPPLLPASTLATRPARDGLFGLVAFSPDGQCLAVTGKDDRFDAKTSTPVVRVWHLGTRQEVVTLRGGPQRDHRGLQPGQPAHRDRQGE